MADEKYSIDDILKEIDSSRSGRQRKSSGADEIRAGDLKSGKQLTATEILSTIKPSGNGGSRNEPSKSARQLSEIESEARIAKEVSLAADRKKPFFPVDTPNDRAAKQLSEDAVQKRIADDIAKAADIKQYQRLTDEVKQYTPQNQRSEEIELHDAKTFTPSETMELRRMKRLESFKDIRISDEDAEQTDSGEVDMLNSLNPMEPNNNYNHNYNKGQLKSDEDTDTLAVTGDDLKNLAKGEERIKEYTPSYSRKRGKTDEDKNPVSKPAPFTGKLHLADNISDAIDMKINEQSSQLSTDTNLNIAKPEEIQPDDEQIEQAEQTDDSLERIRQANELAKKKKLNIEKFIFEGDYNTEESDAISPEPEEEDYEEEDDEEDIPVDINDENVIKDRLTRARKGLISRLIFLLVLFAAAVFVAVVNKYNLKIGRIANIISYRSSPTNYLYVHLGIGILSFSVCSSVISNGFSRLFKLRPDGDTLCALAHMGAIAAMIPYLASPEYISRGFSQIYLAVSLGALIFNTVSKLLTVKTANNNFDFVFGKKSKYFIEQCKGAEADRLSSGTVDGTAYTASVRKTEMLCDFIVSTYCEDSSDRTSRKLVVPTIVAAIACGVIAFFVCDTTIRENRFSWAATISSAILSIAASFSSSLTVMLPVYLASRKSEERGSVILGYSAAEETSRTNSVLVDAKTLFPPQAVKIVNICGYDTPKTRGEGKINIDEAIIYAASLAMASGSVMSTSLFQILNFKEEMLKPVSRCVYENNMGVMGWIDSRRVLLGTRAHMKAHEISVPNVKKETAANKNNDEVVYLAIGGEVCLLFFVKPLADPHIKNTVRSLAENGISLVVKTVDGCVNSPVISKAFNIGEEWIKIIPFELHDSFDENTGFTASGNAAVTCNGTLGSVAGAVQSSKAICAKAAVGNFIQAAGVIIGIIIALIFMLTSKEEQLRQFNIFGLFNILLYNTVFGALALGLPFFRRS